MFLLNGHRDTVLTRYSVHSCFILSLSLSLLSTCGRYSCAGPDPSRVRDFHEAYNDNQTCTDTIALHAPTHVHCVIDGQVFFFLGNSRVTLACGSDIVCKTAFGSLQCARNYLFCMSHMRSGHDTQLSTNNHVHICTYMSIAPFVSQNCSFRIRCSDVIWFESVQYFDHISCTCLRVATKLRA